MCTDVSLESAIFIIRIPMKRQYTSTTLSGITVHKPIISKVPASYTLAKCKHCFHLATQVERQCQIGLLVSNLRLMFPFHQVKTSERISCNNDCNIKLLPVYVPGIPAHSKFVGFVNITWLNIKRQGGIRWKEQVKLLTFYVKGRAVCSSVDLCTQNECQPLTH